MSRGLAAAFVAAVVAACGSSNSGDTANLRIVNATLTHASLSLLANSNAAISSTATDTVSGYSGVPDGSPTLQVNDATTGVVLATTAPSLSKDAHYTLVVYETGGTVRTAVISEDVTAPTTGTAVLRVFDAATDAGAIDVYITDPAVDITTLSSPTVTFAASTQPTAGSFISFAPNTATNATTAYRIRVTGGGNTADLRLDIPSVVLTDQEIATVILTPTTGGTLANGAVLIQQAAYAATRNTNARVRLLADVTNNGSVLASAGGVALGGLATNGTPLPSISPAVGSYVLAPAASTFTITVNGATVTPPVASLVAGADATLSVYGNSAAPIATLITDDNHLPATSTNFKVRLYNGLTGAAAAPLSLSVNFAQLASNVPSGSASAYAAALGSTSTRIDVNSSTGTIYSESSLPVAGNAVFTLFMLGDAGAPVHELRRDH